MAIVQSTAEKNWKVTAELTGKYSSDSQKALANALKLGSKVSFTLSIVSAFDVMVFGIETLEAFKARDMDTAAINAGLTIASAANFVLYAKHYQALKAARTAALAGETATLGRGLSQVPHFAPKIVGFTLLILSGVIARLYTQDKPIEKWLKNTRFGTYPEAWSDSYEKSAHELQKNLSTSS